MTVYPIEQITRDKFHGLLDEEEQSRFTYLDYCLTIVDNTGRVFEVWRDTQHHIAWYVEREVKVDK